MVILYHESIWIYLFDKYAIEPIVSGKKSKPVTHFVIRIISFNITHES